MAWLDDDWMYSSLLDEGEVEESYWRFLLGVPNEETYFCEVTQINDQAFFKLYESDVGFEYSEIESADFEFSTYDVARTARVELEEIKAGRGDKLDIERYATYIKENIF